MPRQTPLERLADRIPRTYRQRNPIPQRMRVPLDSSPADILTQMDNIHSWQPPLARPLPEFPPSYPPEFPPVMDAELLCLAIGSPHNIRLEWIGDTIVKVAVYEFLREARSPSRLPLEVDINSWIVGESVLARLALLYGLHLHECGQCGDSDIPKRERMCRVFEAFVGAVATSLGMPVAIRWLGLLFQPWLAPYGIAPSYNQRPPWELASQPIPDAFNRSQLDWLTVELSKYSDLDISHVHLPADYPGQAPMSPEDLESMMQQVFRDGRIDGVYASLGEPVFRLVISTLIVSRVDVGLRLNSAEKFKARSSSWASAYFLCRPQNIREGMSCIELLSRFGLVCGVHRYMRLTMPGRGVTGWYISPAQSKKAFFALMAYVFVNKGFETLETWMAPFFGPWIDALIREEFTPTPKLIQLRAELHAREARKAVRRLASHSSSRPAAPPGKQSVARARYRGIHPLGRNLNARHK
ncbi:hypothetical protein HMN09_00440700 [Mycena chlorophos]|uniref:RNase III domain-containing protein n=1 Tax=Mycena chlorophos TaxID=658473 RepID=A0A8H6TGU2_MYCCL|nr:hypothetical protein HMN09_00440700 [Mycena chlorophos]